MIFRLGAMFFTACIALAACSDEMTEENGFRENEGEMHMYGAKVALVLPSESGGGRNVMTRAEKEEPGFGNGNSEEYHVDKNNVRFVFLDDNYNTVSVVSGPDINWGDVNNDGSDVTQQGTVRIKTPTKPKYLVVLLNVDETLETALKDGDNISYDKLQNALAPTTSERTSTTDFWLSHVASTANGFLMTNSTYANNSDSPTEANTIKAVDISGYIQEIENIADVKTIEVYVERVVAKATLNVTSIKLKDDTYELPNKDANNKIGVKLLGWTLNATNKSFLPLKKIEGINRDWTEMAGSFYLNSTDNHRSYWAVDDNYDGGTYGANSDFGGETTPNTWNENDLNYYSINDIINDNQKNPSFNGEKASYCLENTMDAQTAANKAAITHMLIVGQYTDKTGEPLTNGEDIYRYGGKIYTKIELGQYIIDKLKYFNYNVGNVQTTDFEFVTNTTWKNRADVKIEKIYYKAEGQNESLVCFKKDGTNLKDLKMVVFDSPTLWVYPQGYCYYTVPIRHFYTGKAASDVGYYGMVRNHWYSVTVTLNGFGEPASPDKPIIPDDPEEEESGYVLNAEIEVLPWAKNEQNSSVGGETEWN